MSQDTKYNYYRDQVERLKDIKALAIKIEDREEKNISTHWLTMNKESAQEIVKFLRVKFNLPL